jgi:hypothetical protein
LREDRKTWQNDIALLHIVAMPSITSNISVAWFESDSFFHQYRGSSNVDWNGRPEDPIKSGGRGAFPQAQSDACLLRFRCGLMAE